ncbi:glycosyltransferase family 4 protein [bacterium]|nr:glycosyltransferase family 4 protein [bacterium]
MKKILIFAYYFPPMGMGGVQRITKFCKFLPAFGWQPTVITVKPTAYYGFDETLSGEIKQTKIHRTESLDPLRLAYFLNKTKKAQQQTSDKNSFVSKLFSLFLPDNKILWVPFAIKKAKKLLETETFDAVFTTSPPHSVHFAGLYVKKNFGITWIADFRDDWVGGHLDFQKNKFMNSISKRMEQKILKNADAIISVTETTTQNFQAKLNRNSEKFFTITNGFDLEDFVFEQNFEPQKKFTITYTGSISKFADPIKILEALKILASKVGKDKILIKFIGTFTNSNFEEMISTYEKYFEIQKIGYLPHKEAIFETAKTDILLLLAESNLTGMIPGKLFEYLAYRKPILGVLPKSDSFVILSKVSNAKLCEPHEESEILANIELLYNDWKNNSLDKNSSDFSVFERKNLTARLVEILGSKNNKKSLTFENKA